ncbi:MAG: purine-binding chemotaxis protein CheW [Deferribacteres bacterium]|jgi:purine-binding chemotaxis protein CheW|nr:CheW protein [Deferribacteraceae bacterium]MDK2791842.1 purine-binding chemotaxis protein CheW [Deferribacteres bacterium]
MSKISQFVGFKLGKEKYAIDIMVIEEILRKTEITPVPKAPDFIQGIINIRGRVIPVVDLKNKLNLGMVDDSQTSRIIITNIGGKKVGFLVDEVDEVLRIEKDIIEDAPALAVNIDSQYIKGVAKTEGGMVILLDITKIFSPFEQKQFNSF